MYVLKSGLPHNKADNISPRKLAFGGPSLIFQNVNCSAKNSHKVRPSKSAYRKMEPLKTKVISHFSSYTTSFPVPSARQGPRQMALVQAELLCTAIGQCNGISIMICDWIAGVCFARK